MQLLGRNIQNKMVSRSKKNQMTEFVTERLEDSGLYDIQQRDHAHILVSEKPDSHETPKTIDVIAHNYKRTSKELVSLIRQNQLNDISNAHIFYKNGKDFLVRLGFRGLLKEDDRSLKYYDKAEVVKMIHLRDLEKSVLDICSSKILAYYQPKTARLEEGVRIYKMDEVILDYSHVKEIDKSFAFVETKSSIDYKIANEIIIANQQTLHIKTNDRNFNAVIEPHLWNLLNKKDKKEEVEERTAIMLDNCSNAELKYLTKTFGSAELGNYAK